MKIDIFTDRNTAFTGDVFGDLSSSRCNVILLPTLWGCDGGAAEISAKLVSRGLAVVVPDMFHRTNAPGTLNRKNPDEAANAISRYEEFDVAQGIEDTLLACSSVKKRTSKDHPLIALGFCFGGRYAFDAAIKGAVDGALSFHGTSLDQHLMAVSSLKCPVSIHYGTDDPIVPSDEVERVRTGTRNIPGIELVMHQGCKHGFMMPDNPNFSQSAFDLGWHHIVTLTDSVTM